jgi:hypothetical protein
MSQGLPSWTIRLGFRGERSGFMTRRRTRRGPWPAPGHEVAGGLQVEVEGALQVPDPHVHPAARPEKVLDLRVPLGPAQRFRDLDHGHGRDGEPEFPGQLPHQDLGDEGPGSLPGAPELHHPQPAIPRLHHRRQRSPLSEGDHVPGGGKTGEGGG